MTEGLTKTRPSPPPQPGKQGSTCRQPPAARVRVSSSASEHVGKAQTLADRGRALAYFCGPRGMWPPLSPATAQQHPAWGVLPATTALVPLIVHPLPHVCPSPICLVLLTRRSLSFSVYCMSDCLETLSTAGLPPRHADQMNRMLK